MAVELFRISCLNPKYLTEKYEGLRKYYNNSPISKRARGYHYIYLKDDCHLFDTKNHRDGYHFIDLHALGHCAYVNVAVFVYFMEHGMKKSCLPTVLENQISHLCHHSSCVNPKHFTLETCKTNNQRKKCHIFWYCSGHCKQPPCHY